MKTPKGKTPTLIHHLSVFQTGLNVSFQCTCRPPFCKFCLPLRLSALFSHRLCLAQASERVLQEAVWAFTVSISPQLGFGAGLFVAQGEGLVVEVGGGVEWCG